MNATRSQVKTPEANPQHQRFRQVHLDFHTSEFIPEIGAQFDPDEFADTLQKAHVNSINCFARGHHGWMYYHSQKFPERRHPHLTQNLLPLQIEACHKRDIRVPIYVSLQLDFFTVKHHPEWRLIEPDGMPNGALLHTSNFWKKLCLNTPYVDFLKDHIAELFELMPVDGLWLDIIAPLDCSCQYCWADMEHNGLDPRNTHHRQLFGRRMVMEFMLELTDHIHKFDRECLVYYNSGHIWPFHRQASPAFTHFDLESLASSMLWPYPYFQTAARYARNLNKDIIGMTGKFHSIWGDFHSFKSQPALEFDCFQALAVNAKCSIGDQLHPCGKIDPVTYDLIGAVYAQVAAKEPWCQDATAIAEIGVLTSEEFELLKLDNATRHPETLTGAVRMLLEADRQFDVIDSAADFSRYKLLVLPDQYPVTRQVKLKLEQFLESGGKLIASFEAGMDEHKTEFQLDALGIQKASDGPVDENGQLVRGVNDSTNSYVEYIIPQGDIGVGLHPTEYVMYARGMHILALDGSEVLLYNTKSYFDRQGDHFCSHKQTPSSGQLGAPAVVRNGSVIYFSHPLFKLYYDKAPWWCKRLFLNAIEMLIGDPLIKTDAPSTTIITLNQQSQHNRLVLHLLHYIPERRGQEFDIIEDIIPLHNISVELRLTKNVKHVQLVPEQTSIEHHYDSGVARFVVPQVRGHQMVEIAFA